jgi:hypothetical protein
MAAKSFAPKTGVSGLTMQWEQDYAFAATMLKTLASDRQRSAAVRLALQFAGRQATPLLKSAYTPGGDYGLYSHTGNLLRSVGYRTYGNSGGVGVLAGAVGKKHGARHWVELGTHAAPRHHATKAFYRLRSVTPQVIARMRSGFIDSFEQWVAHVANK